MEDNGVVVEKLDKVLEKESFWHKYVLQLVIIIFVAGGGWVTLSNVEALAQENKVAIEQEKDSNAAIKQKLLEVEITQDFIQEKVEETKELSKENSRKLDEILKEIRKK